MAPREATGTFPDQFLTFDYDAGIPLGVPPPHDPLPVANEGESDDLGTVAEDALNHWQLSLNQARVRSFQLSFCVHNVWFI